jgi:hypothetical protein
LKFITLFFLLAIVLTVNVLVAESKGTYNAHSRKAVADTIIKLDTTKAKDRKLLKIKKSQSKKPTQNPITEGTSGGLNLNIKPITDTTVVIDTNKNKKLQVQPVLPKERPAATEDTTTKKGGIQSEVKAVAEDSTIVDNERNIIYLYGRARVTYEDFELDAEYIRVDQKNHLIFASGLIDPRTKRYLGRPLSKSKSEKPVASDSLLFNYDTKKGKLYNPASEQEGNFISGGQVKKLNETEAAYRNVIFSTCDLPYPDTHFGIVITKGIGEKNRIISGPAYLEIEGVPLPIAIPFGFFPKPNSRTSGVILPTFGEDAKLGFKLAGFGYYLGISDYIDLTTTGTIYSKGSYEVNTTARYLVKYKYTGNLSLSYGSHNYQLPGDPPVKDIHIDWTHSQDPNANPGSTFSASVNAGTSGYFGRNPSNSNYNVVTAAQSSLRSSISYGKTWAGTPFNLSVGIGHSQDIASKTISIELPSIAFGMSSINPFDSKDRVGEQKWYQKITVSYNLNATNKVNSIPESELFKSTISRRLQNGVQHQIPISLGLNVLKYFQFNSSVNYTERWYFQSIKQRYERGSINNSDQLLTDTVQGFQRAGNYSLSTGLSTKLYGTLNFKGNLKAIRHVITPSIGFGYTPDYNGLDRSYNKIAISQASIPYPFSYQRYSILSNGVYGYPSGGKQAGISFSVDNTIEAKLKAKSTDTSGTDRKVSILQGLSFSTFYNMAADSMKLSPIQFSGHTALFKQKVNVSFSGSLNPYVVAVHDSISENSIKRVSTQTSKYRWSNGQFPQLSNFTLSMSGSLNSTSAKAPGTPNVNTLQNIGAQQAQRLALINSDPNSYVDFNVPWNISLNYSYSYSNYLNNVTTNNTLMISGDVSITQKWKIQYSTNYDFKAMKLASATSFSIYRDLHCWDLSFQWVPFGYLKSYNVTLKVKSTILQDLKLSKRNDYSSNRTFY